MYIDTISIIVTNKIKIDSFIVIPDKISFDTSVRTSFVNILGYFSENGVSKVVEMNNYFSSYNYNSEVVDISKEGKIDAKKPEEIQ